MAVLLSGAPVAQALGQRIERDCNTLKEHGIVPTFGIVRAGARPDDLVYERGACKRAEKLGVQVKKMLLPEDVSEEQLAAVLEQVNADDEIHGCLLFRPLPPHLDTKKISGLLRPEKDVDAITTASM
ncbi:MAG: bifunctional 5,10-methylene-tetrahydrofolate dehydrogenase/5,10-methylene-tetrahydrofolate cyclohydrolase, partial [Oscillospiraceae bacterium]|nr:bifunctional 5,10-methylene-tetrahydrofolate dehydrogenase/5,10-methylene-tetrahydrofolate cyclohydrolase [Oscillospiraceae bacterium]